MRKLVLAFFLLLLLLPGTGVCGTAASLPIGGPAPYTPVAEAYADDNLSYDDGTLSIHIDIDVAYDVNIYYVYVQLTDPSQFRTALCNPYPSDDWTTVSVMAERNNAVLAINGDFFSHHNEGYIVRSGQRLRNNPKTWRDVLIVDENADFHYIVSPRAKAIEAFTGTIREAFSFGPALIIDSVVQEFSYRDKVSCGYPTRDQRLAICQLEPLSYLIVMTDGSDKEHTGLTIPEFTQLLVDKNVQSAYNLDGGNSCTLVINGERINSPDFSKERDVSDIIYFATLVSN